MHRDTFCTAQVSLEKMENSIAPFACYNVTMVGVVENESKKKSQKGEKTRKRLNWKGNNTGNQNGKRYHLGMESNRKTINSQIASVTFIPFHKQEIKFKNLSSSFRNGLSVANFFVPEQ